MFVIKDNPLPTNFITNSDQLVEKCMEGAIAEDEHPGRDDRGYDFVPLQKNSMAQPNLKLVHALRDTATMLRSGVYYAWGHHGACNCGCLLQTITHLTKEEILNYAHSSTGEWTEIAEEHCATTGVPAYLMISKLEETGLTATDIHNLEYLEDREVLKYLPGGFRWLKKNLRKDVILYFEAFADMLEEKMVKSIHINYEELTEPTLSF